MRFIGDIHGKFMTYRNLVDGIYESTGGGSKCEASIQIGDYGLGFDPVVDTRQLAWADENPQHRFIRGNHDSPAVCAEADTWIEDGYFDGTTFFMGGAWSIDHARRIPGRSWWEDEEVSYEKMIDLIEQYAELKPRFMVTHDCPTNVAWEMHVKGSPYPWLHKTRTGQALEEMFQQWKPEVWIYGHWHQTRIGNIDGTTFVCLGELAYFDLNRDTGEFTLPRTPGLDDNMQKRWIEYDPMEQFYSVDTNGESA